MKHLYWECEKIQCFWTQIKQWCLRHNLTLEINQTNIFLGILDVEPVGNIIIYLGKQFIYLCRNKSEDNKLNVNSFIYFVKSYKQVEFNVQLKRNKLSHFIERWRLFSDI